VGDWRDHPLRLLSRALVPLLSSAFAHLGRDAEAREAAARLLEVDPSFTVPAWIDRGRQSKAKLMIEGLRKAGLPE
jgi:adenylate cyclase